MSFYIVVDVNLEDGYLKIIGLSQDDWESYDAFILYHQDLLKQNFQIKHPSDLYEDSSDRNVFYYTRNNELHRVSIVNS